MVSNIVVIPIGDRITNHSLLRVQKTSYRASILVSTLLLGINEQSPLTLLFLYTIRVFSSSNKKVLVTLF